MVVDIGMTTWTGFVGNRFSVLAYAVMRGLAPEKRYANHKAGIKAAAIVRRYGERLLPELYQHLAPMSYQDALAMEKELFEELKAKGYQVFGGH